MERDKYKYSVGLGKNCVNDDGFFGTSEMVFLAGDSSSLLVLGAISGIVSASA